MVNQLKHLYEFTGFRLDPHERLLQRDGKPVPLTPKVFDLLLLLVENKGRLLEKEDLMQTLWQDSYVEESNLSFNISTLRKALGEDPKNRRYIETVPKRGYRFIAEVKIVGREIADVPETVEALSIPIPSVETEKVQSTDISDLTAAEKNETKSDDEAQKSPKAPFAHQSKPGNGKAFYRAALTALAFVFTAALCLGIYMFARWGANPLPNTVSAPMKVTRLTSARNAVYAAISPDGKYVAYVTDEARQRALWLRQVSTNSDTQLIPPADVYYLDVVFSSDGNYVNYFKAEPDSPPALYQIPLLGGTPRKLIEDAPSPALSPDGKQFAFIKQSGDGEVALSVANAADGSGEQKLLTRRQPEFLDGANWSPDGESIVCIAGSVTETGRRADLVEMRLADRTERVITSEQWKFIGRIEFLPDKSGIMATVADYPFGPYQIWHVSYPDGKASRVTNDLSNYGNISLTADSKSVVTVQSDIRPSVWVLPGSNAEKAKQITSSPGTVNDYWGFSWSPDGRIVYVSTSGGNHNIWIMNADGSDQKQLTFGEHSNFDPSVSPDGRNIVFASDRSGIAKIWQMDINGENLKQITSGGTSDFLPFYMPDGHSIGYTSSDTRKMTLWKTRPGENSPPVRLTGYNSTWGAVSPDGALIAAWHLNEQKRAMELIVLSSSGGDPIKSFSVSPTTKTWSNVHWTSDGRALTYIDTMGGVGNIWLQPLNGDPPRQLTDFKTERIFRFAWSPDGKQLVLSRGIETNDVVLIGNFR